MPLSDQCSAIGAIRLPLRRRHLLQPTKAGLLLLLPLPGLYPLCFVLHRLLPLLLLLLLLLALSSSRVLRLGLCRRQRVLKDAGVSVRFHTGARGG